MKVPVFYCHATNRVIYNKLYTLTNTDGKRALSEHSRRIVEYVASFDQSNGCYVRNSCINAMTCRTSMKTFKYNLLYLLAIGALKETMASDQYTNEKRRILRLGLPGSPVIPQKIFRCSLGITSYGYLKTEKRVKPRPSNYALVFPVEIIKGCIVPGLDPKNGSSEPTFLCIDLGLCYDPTSLIVGDLNGAILYTASFPLGMDWDKQFEYIKEIADKYNSTCVFETNGTNRDALISLIRPRLAPHEVFDMPIRKNNKRDLINKLRLAMEQKQIKIPSNESGTKPHHALADVCCQLEGMRYNNEASEFYSSLHDDYVSALMIYVESFGQINHKKEHVMEPESPNFLMPGVEKSSLFQEKSQEKSSLEAEPLFLCIKDKEETKELETKKEETPKVPFHALACGLESKDEPWGGSLGHAPRAQQQQTNTNLPVPPKKNEYPRKETMVGEPLLERFRKKRPKNSRERRAEAAKLHNAGHIASPAGIKDNRGRRLKPMLACTIGDIGAVSEPQLYRFLYERYKELGWEGVLEQELPPYREALAFQLNELRQNFIRTCSHNPENRDLYEYFKWFLDPSRLSGSMKTAAKVGQDHVSWRQIKGAACIRRFYDHVLVGKKQASAAMSPPRGPNIHAIRDEYIKEIFQKITESVDDTDLVLHMLSYGFVMFAQYLHDMKGISDPSECKKRIISLLVGYLRNQPNKAHAIDVVKRAGKTTRENTGVNRLNTVWPDNWKEATADFVNIALEQAKVG